MRGRDGIMRLRFALLLALLFLLVLGGGVVVSPLLAQGQAASDLEKEIEERRAEMDRLKKESERLGRELKEARTEGEAATSRLHAAEINLRKTRTDLNYLNSRMSLLQAEIRKGRNEVERLNEDLKLRQKVLSQRMVGIYKQSRLAYLEILLSAEDLVELEQTARYLSLIAERDSELIGETLVKRAEREEQLAGLAEREEDLNQTKRQLTGKKREQEQVKNQRQQLVKQINSDIALAEQRKREVERQQKELQALVNELSERLARVRSTGFGALRGYLPWPVRGSVFTPENLPTNLRDKAVLIRAPFGSNVAAVSRGEVVYTGWQRGYGNIVIIGHGDRFMSLYAHLNSIAVEVGETVTQGGVIGTVGETASLYGVHLHFEIRKDGAALESGSWLKR